MFMEGVQPGEHLAPSDDMNGICNSTARQPGINQKESTALDLDVFQYFCLWNHAMCDVEHRCLTPSLGVRNEMDTRILFSSGGCCVLFHLQDHKCSWMALSLVWINHSLHFSRPARHFAQTCAFLLLTSWVPASVEAIRDSVTAGEPVHVHVDARGWRARHALAPVSTRVTEFGRLITRNAPPYAT